MEPENLARKARKSISTFCFEECHAYCCRKGHLKIKEEERLVIDPKKAFENIIVKIDKDNFSLDMGAQGCPALDSNFRCKVHKNKKRPHMCNDFPLILYSDSIAVSQDCPAVSNNILYPYIAKFKKMGFKIIYF